MASITTINLNPSSSLPQVPSVIAGFWKRLLAAFIDMLVVGVVGFVIGITFFDFLTDLGAWGRVVGFAISLPYFCISNSSIGRGQTLGKRMFGVRVVNAQGRTISPERAAVRYAVMSLPFFFNGIALPGPAARSEVVLFITEVIVFGVGAAIIYLYASNRATRQSLHDLTVGTYVIDSATQGNVGVRPIWKGHVFVLSAVLAAILGIGKVVELKLTKSHDFQVFQSIVEKLQDSGKVYNSYAGVVTKWGGSTEHRLVVRARWRGKPGFLPRAMTEIAAIVLDQAPDILGNDALAITVTYGFDIGIASGWRSNTEVDSLEGWRQKIH